MSFWLHALVIYPLAALGAAVIVGLGCLFYEPTTVQGCGRCGAKGEFPRYGMQQWPVCPSCREADAAREAQRERAKVTEVHRL